MQLASANLDNCAHEISAHLVQEAVASKPKLERRWPELPQLQQVQRTLWVHLHLALCAAWSVAKGSKGVRALQETARPCGLICIPRGHATSRWQLPLMKAPEWVTALRRVESIAVLLA
eukprot:CAMPEP_0115877944 /NCGR_PEP_ID=MMETSP0287-20121206/26500_1 /TAXON_ID=412157 /ORGANISM="Chrysochromulina rotalis, Strain UIO044" /LENGTH=117 /DNA_ID=CAMNT_0003333507 /DNA_START=290 /DNA_END=643 /DNA_ORIENTATION=-